MSFSCAAGTVHATAYFGVDSVDHTRHDEHHRGFHFLHVLGHGFDTFGKGDDAAKVGPVKLSAYSFENVRHRQIREINILLVDWKKAGRSLYHR